MCLLVSLNNGMNSAGRITWIIKRFKTRPQRAHARVRGIMLNGKALGPIFEFKWQGLIGRILISKVSIPTNLWYLYAQQDARRRRHLDIGHV